MAAARADMASVEDSSSSDDELLKRCREAAWDTQNLKTNDTRINEKPSKRLVVADHEHDGNELHVTQGFQTHVAKKLCLILDGLISEKQPSIVLAEEKHDIKEDEDEDEDEGFRLFSTSVPGQKTEEAPGPKRRPLPSSSDSDSEMEARLKEAAISVQDLLPKSTSVLLTNSEPEIRSSEAEKVKRKEEKRKMNQEDNEQHDSKSEDIQKHIVNLEEEQVHTTPVKSKKKKKKKGIHKNSEGEVLS